ncbi:MAG: aminotransferase class V-fold PLP-dependent enzyme [Candidatus Sericytochromatia bacterium]|nr:aminotransferase class V-fold PLP-dependent enzyme [Candidatus Sericytochromatia bacterium]
MPPEPVAGLAAVGAGTWLLEPGLDFLNHGSFGACPRPVLAAQQAWRERMEAQPVRFLARELEGLLDEVREALAAFLGADPAGLAFVPNATTGVATVLAGLPLRPGDELLTTTQAYPAVRKALRRTAERTGARVVEAEVPFPLAGPGDVIGPVLAATGPRTRLAVLDHITSPTAVVYPIEALVKALARRGVDTLVDGAHAPGQVALNLRRLGAAYYTGNCHKWLGAPKGAAFLHVRADRRARVAPLVTSHGFYNPRDDRAAFQLTFDWVGTLDPTAVLAVPAAIACLGGLLEGGWPALMARNRALASLAQGLLAEALGVDRPVPEEMLPAMASLPLPPGEEAPPPGPPVPVGLQARLLDAGFELPLFPHPAGTGRLVRVSAFAYNHPAQYERLAGWLAGAVGRPRCEA